MVTVDTSEVDELISDLMIVGERVGAPAAAVLRSTAVQTERDAKRFAPVLTGRLRDSISTDIEGDGRFTSMQAEIGPTVDYGNEVEYGTSDTPPEPFMGPAFEKNVGPFEEALGRVAELALS